jgi:hypothetical protein
MHVAMQGHGSPIQGSFSKVVIVRFGHISVIGQVQNGTHHRSQTSILRKDWADIVQPRVWAGVTHIRMSKVDRLYVLKCLIFMAINAIVEKVHLAINWNGNPVITLAHRLSIDTQLWYLYIFSELKGGNAIGIVYEFANYPIRG